MKAPATVSSLARVVRFGGVAAFASAAIGAFAALAAACGDDAAVATPPDPDASYEASAPTGPCNAVVQEHAIEGFLHVPVCSYVTYGTNPPSSGNHYPIWAAYQTYTSPVPDGFFVHNLEHGTIVLTYNCALSTDGGCANDVDAAQTMLDGLPADPDCAAQGSAVRRRSLMTPDPSLDVEFAASSWGWTLRADCFDPVAFQSFALAHYNQGREDICADGDDVAIGLEANCGLPDGG